ncbi:hypothetical protein SPHINGOT1_10006 [Sphingomonas sp. T1]|nr:hypothetical protein SPHINGOT1_10006 [Sphingomonas sp. T1]
MPIRRGRLAEPLELPERQARLEPLADAICARRVEPVALNPEDMRVAGAAQPTTPVISTSEAIVADRLFMIGLPTFQERNCFRIGRIKRETGRKFLVFMR